MLHHPLAYASENGLPGIDFVQIKRANPFFTEEKVLELLSPIDPDHIQLAKVSELPHENVVEMTKPRHII